MKKIKAFKTIFAAILCFIMIMSVCSCTEKTSVSSDDNNTSQATTTSDSSINNKQEDSSEDAQTQTSSVAPKPAPSSSKKPTPSSSKKPTPSSSKKPTPPPAASSSKPAQTTTSTTPPPAPKTPAQIIVGKWRGSTDMGPAFESDGFVVDEPLMVTFNMEFTANGFLYEVVDRPSLQAAYTKLLNKTLENTLIEENLTKQQFEAEVGMTYDEYLAELVQLSMNSVPVTMASTYKFEGNDLYVRDQEDTDFEKEEYSLNGENQLTLVDANVSLILTRVG